LALGDIVEFAEPNRMQDRNAAGEQRPDLDLINVAGYGKRGMF